MSAPESTDEKHQPRRPDTLVLDVYSEYEIDGGVTPTAVGSERDVDIDIDDDDEDKKSQRGRDEVAAVLGEYSLNESVVAIDYNASKLDLGYPDTHSKDLDLTGVVKDYAGDSKDQASVHEADSGDDNDELNKPPSLSTARRIGLICIVTFTMCMSAGGQQGLNIALPIIQTELGISESNLQWISSAYSLTSGCFLLLSGRLADVYGRKRCFMLGIAWYAIWCLAGSFMQSAAGLVVSRALAGAGASMGIPSAIGIIASNIHGKDRATAFACFAAGAPVGGGTGMVLGGVLAAYTDKSWRAILWIFTGLATMIVVPAYFFVPPDKPNSHDKRIDWIGAALVTVGLVTLQFSVSDGVSAPNGWKTPYIYVLFIVSIFCLIGFFCWEYYTIHKTSRPPLMRLALFTRAKGRLAAIYFVGFVAWMGFISIGYHATLFYQQVQMTGTVGALLRFLPCSISGIICNFIVAKIVHRVPTQIIVCTGLIATGLSSTFMALSGKDELYWRFPFNAMYLMVVGADFLMATGSIFVSRLALPQEQSVAGALFQTLIQLGGSFGLTLTSVMATTYEAKGLAQGLDEVDALLMGLHASFWLGAAFSFSALILALVMLRGLGIVSKVDGGHGGPGSTTPAAQGTAIEAESPGATADEKV